MRHTLRRAAPAALAAGLIALTSIPWHQGPDADAVADASSGISFSRQELPASQGNQQERPVQPNLDHISTWISAVGASVGSADIRGQGVSGDGCLTDPRDDTLKIFPVPGSTGEPFEAFELKPEGLRYDRTMAPIGCVPTDIDQDGRQDVIAYYWGRSPIVFRNTGAEGDIPTADMFEAEELVAPMQVWNTTALNVADVDGDGNLDIMVGNYFPDNARVLDENATDDDNMAMQQSMGGAHNAGPNRLFLGTDQEPGRPLSFSDQSAKYPAEAAKSWTLAFGAQDLTGDGLPELYAANDFGPDQMFVNRSTPGNVRLDIIKGSRSALTAKSKVLGNDSFKGMGVTYSYAEGDDLPSIFVSNITSPRALHESNLVFRPQGDGEDMLDGTFPYREDSTASGMAQSGWSWDIKPIDPTNSGTDALIQANGFIKGPVNQWPRLQETAMGNDQILALPGAWLNIGPDGGISGDERNRLWVDADGTFADVGDKAGFTTDEVSRGFAVADVNADGRQDFLVANQWGASYAHLNESKSENPYVSLRVVREARHGDTPLTGAKVTLKGPNYQRRAQSYPANGHSGVSGNELHFAVPEESLDGATATVQWRDENGLHTETFDVTPGTQELKVKTP